MKTIFLFCALSLLSVNSSAEGVYLLKEEANKALYNLSHCTQQVSEVLVSGTWIGKTERWDSEKNYGYTYYVFKRSGFTSTKPIGKISMVANFREKPPADASAYRYECFFSPAPSLQ